MTLAPGQAVSFYEILGSIGAGGMGEVWRARDTRLEREVAIKVLPDAFADDEERMRRFEREAKTLASLSHPNIAQIFEIGQDGDTCFLVLELVRGEDLSERIARGRLTLEETLDIARQICEGLVAAHDSGIVHRDLKPANVRVTPDGTVKLLDFGLAKAAADSGAGSGTSKPDSFLLTEEGMVLGTPTYMSPEQARAKPVDRRTDIWAFGCVLYECLTARRAFDGSSTADIIAAIVDREAAFERLPASTPPRIVELLRRTLEKDPRRRLQHLGDARVEIERALEDPDEAVLGAAPGARRVPWLVAGVALGALLAWAAIGRIAPPDAPSVGGRGVLHVSVPRPRTPVGIHSRIAPDGSAIVYEAFDSDASGEQRNALYLRRLDSSEAVRLPGTTNAGTLAFAPDGKSIAVVVADESARSELSIVRVHLDGGTPRVVPIGPYAPDPNLSSGLAWLDGDLLVTTGNRNRLMVMPLEERRWRELPIQGLVDAHTYTPDLFRGLPGGRHVLAHSFRYGPGGYEPVLSAIDVESGEAHALVSGGNGAWSATGHLVYTVGEVLYAVPFDPERLETTGVPRLLFDGLRTVEPWRPAWFDLAGDGTLVHEPGGTQGKERSFVVMNEDGDVEPWPFQPRIFDGMTMLSRDGSFLASAVVASNGLIELWGSDMDAPLLRPLLTGQEADFMPGPIDVERGVLYYSRRVTDDTDGIWVAPLDSPGRTEPVLTRKERGTTLVPFDVTPDGETLIARESGPERVHAIAIPLVGSDGGAGEPRHLFDVSSNTWGMRVSPDGRWLTYVEPVDGRDTAILRELRADGTCGPVIPVPLGRGDVATWVEWTRSAPTDPPTLLITVYGRDRIVEVSLLQSDPPRFSEPRFRAAVDFDHMMDYDPLPGGRILMLMRGESERATERIDVVLGFTSLLAQD